MTKARKSKGRRLHPRTNITASPIIASQEATRNPHHQEALQVLRFSVELEDVEVAGKATGSNRPQKVVQFPRRLLRPPFVAISPAALEAVDPQLKEVALEFIYNGLRMLGPEIYAVASTSQADIPSERLPRELDVVINDISSEAPTHVLATKAKPATRPFFFPVHAIILATHCARLPPFPQSASQTPAEAGSKITLPVITLSIPNPETFPIILHYLYTKHVDRLSSALLPLPLQDGKSIDELSQTYSSTFTVQALLSHVNRVHGLWSNTAAFGIFDGKLCDVIEMAWDVLLKALAVSTGAKWETV